MHGLHSRYPEEKNKMIALNHKLLEQVKVVAKEVNFAVMPSSRKSVCDVITYPLRHCDVINDVAFPEVW